jgi:hypothetical protein
LTAERSRQLASELEQGSVLYMPQLAFALSDGERRFIDPRWADPKAKNISYDGSRDELAGAVGAAADLDQLRQMLARYRAQAVGLIETLLPAYRKHLRIARTSLRTMRVESISTANRACGASASRSRIWHNAICPRSRRLCRDRHG